MLIWGILELIANMEIVRTLVAWMQFETKIEKQGENFKTTERLMARKTPSIAICAFVDDFVGTVRDATIGRLSRCMQLGTRQCHKSQSSQISGKRKLMTVSPPRTSI